MLECSSSSVLAKTRTKRKKKEEVEVEVEHENVDMISHLPPLLHHIFSFLDIKQAIQTCILSRRWRYFWVSLPTLNFNYTPRGKGGGGTGYPKTKKNKSNFMDFVDRLLLLHRSNFMDFVDRVLLLRDNSSNIHKLSLDNSEIQCDITYRLNTWILTSVLRNIQQLTLRIYPATSIWEFPHCLNDCKTLTKLVLDLVKSYDCTTVILPAPGSFTLPRLKSLSIEAVQFGKKNSINGFISDERCLPVLETLILIDVHFLEGSGLNISSLKLKHLRLERCRAPSVDIHLDSPNLISLYYTGSIFKNWIIEKNLSSLVKADVNAIIMDSAAKIVRYPPQTAYILRELHNVEELTLSLDSLKIFTEAPELSENHSMLFLKLKCLKLNCIVLSLELLGVIAYLLNACPNIETLCLRVHCGRPYCNEKIFSSANQGDGWGAGLSLKCLKFFEFRNVNARFNELKFIEILLSKAVVLEKLFIVFGFGKSSSDDKKCRVKFKENVLTFPRVSSRAAILFK